MRALSVAPELGVFCMMNWGPQVGRGLGARRVDERRKAGQGGRGSPHGGKKSCGHEHEAEDNE